MSKLNEVQLGNFAAGKMLLQPRFGLSTRHKTEDREPSINVGKCYVFSCRAC